MQGITFKFATIEIEGMAPGAMPLLFSPVTCTKQTISAQNHQPKPLKINNPRTKSGGGGSVYKLCRHIRTSGDRCRSAALPSQHFCHYHATQRQVLPERAPLQLPPLEDRFAIQIAIGRVLAAFASGVIDRKDAGMYLYGVQIASSNLSAGEYDSLSPLNPVRRVVLTRQNQHVAEAETVVEERDTRGHKKGCRCDTCYGTETDDPHHPDCRCGECHYFAVAESDAVPEKNEIGPEEGPEKEAEISDRCETLTIHAVAGSCRERKGSRQRCKCTEKGQGRLRTTMDAKVSHPFALSPNGLALSLSKRVGNSNRTGRRQLEGKEVLGISRAAVNWPPIDVKIAPRVDGSRVEEQPPELLPASE